MTCFGRAKLVLCISAINTIKGETRLRQWPKFFPLPRVSGKVEIVEKIN